MCQVPPKATLSQDMSGMQVEYLLNTGNLGTGSGSNIDLSQASGFTIVAEKLNFFRCESAWIYIDHNGQQQHMCMPVYVTCPMALCMRRCASLTASSRCFEGST